MSEEHRHSQTYSGLEAWRELADEEPRRDTAASYLPLLLSAAGALGVFPFMVLRYMQGEWIAAAVDTIIVAGFCILGMHVYLTRKTRFASIAISIFCILGTLTTVYVIGPQQIFWLYPAIITVFYLTRPNEALALSIVNMGALLPALIGSLETQAVVTIIATAAVMSSFAYAFAIITNKQRAKLIALATQDALTGAGNRRHFDNKLGEMVAAKKRNGTPTSMLLLDLDHFKKVNDVHGHAAGDQILKRITEIIQLRIRVTDTLFRIGGEEFVVLLEGQGIDQADHLAEQLRTLVEANELIPDQLVTVSIGVAELNAGESRDSWLHRADEALYQAKRAGRNTTRIAA